MATVYASPRMWNASDPYTCAESEANASYIFSFFKARGFSDIACAGIVGNTTYESYNNPAFHEVGGSGFGIVQWTPASNYINWARPRGFPVDSDVSNPEKYLQGQCERIIYEMNKGIEFFGNSRYGRNWHNIPNWNAYMNMSADNFSPEDAAYCFLSNYERPRYDAAMASLQRRQNYARLWYDKFQNGKSTQNVKTASLAAKWAVGIAEDDANHGYDQNSRWGDDYDCSSLVISAYDEYGLGLKAAGATYTGNMRSVMINKGFRDVTSEINLTTGSGLIEGDVLINTVHHAAMALGNGDLVQASVNEFGGTRNGRRGDQTGREIYVRSYYNFPWNNVLRYDGYSGFGTEDSASGVSITRAVPITKTSWASNPERNG